MAYYTPRQKYNLQRNSARSRGIRWFLTFEEWWNIWQKSGHWNERGKGKYQYCMARFGDIGPYSVDNVRIITVRQNLDERQFSEEGRRRTNEANKRPCTEERKEKLRKVKRNDEFKRELGIRMIGNTYGKGNAGKPRSLETKLKIGAKKKGQMHREDSKEKMAEVRRKWWEEKRAQCGGVVKLSDSHKKNISIAKKRKNAAKKHAA